MVNEAARVPAAQEVFGIPSCHRDILTIALCILEIHSGIGNFHRKTIGNPWENGGLMGFNGI